MRLVNGFICREKNCSACCHQTEMPLTGEDIDRISRMGYRLEEFAVQVNGGYRLKNVNGRCFFLNEDGLCEIYDGRPLGCRAYPIINIEGECLPDYEICPYAHFADEEDILKGCEILKQVFDKLASHQQV